MFEWLSFEWFKVSTLLDFEWANPLYLYGLFLIPLLILFNWIFTGRQKNNLGLSLTQNLHRNSKFALLRYLIPGFLLIGLACIIISLARPQRDLHSADSFSEGIDIMLAIDISDSMLGTDMSPNRLGAAKKVAKEFIEKRPNDRIGLVVFAGESFALSPLTTDHQILMQYVDDISNTLIPTSGTAIGNALATCINRLRDLQGNSKVTIILSDGDNTAGNLDPEMAVELAKNFNIRIYTIAVGKNSNQEIINETTLKMLAKEGSGKFFRASDNTTLSNIFEKINKIEKVKFKNESKADLQDYYYIYLNWAILFLLLSLLLKNTFVANVMID